MWLITPDAKKKPSYDTGLTDAISLELASNLCLKRRTYCDKLSYAETVHIQWNIFFHRRLGTTSGTFIDISHWNAALISHVTPLCNGHRLSYAPWFKSPYRFVPLNVIIFISHHTVTTPTLKKYTINMCKAAVVLQFKTAATWKEINRIQAPEMIFLGEVEGCAKYDWILTKAIGNVWKLFSRGKEYRITDENGYIHLWAAWNYVKIQTMYRRTRRTTMTSIDRTVKMEQAIP